MNSVDITIVQVPKYVTFDCPYCGEEIEVSYDDFICGMKDVSPSEWEHDCFFCPECMGELEVGGIDWD